MSRSKRAVIYGGCGKTGSSAIQAFLAKLSGQLSDSGWLYPTFGYLADDRPWLDSLLFSLESNFYLTKHSSKFREIYNSNALDIALEGIRSLSDHGQIILASEIVSNSTVYSKSHLTRLLLECFNQVQFIFYVRNPYDYLLKCAAQDLLGGSQTLSGFLSYPYLEGQSSSLNPYRECISDKTLQMSVYSYDAAIKANEGSILPHFMSNLQSLLGITLLPNTSTPSLQLFRNTALPGPAYYFAGRMNELIKMTESDKPQESKSIAADFMSAIINSLGETDSSVPFGIPSSLSDKLYHAARLDEILLESVYAIDSPKSVYSASKKSAQNAKYYDHIVDICRACETPTQLIHYAQKMS